jgi:hypothetical protein
MGVGGELAGVCGYVWVVMQTLRCPEKRARYHDSGRY